MTTRKYEVINKGNKHSKLTVTPDRVTVKLGKDEKNPDHIEVHSKRIAKELDSTGQAMRGVFNWETHRITMESDAKSKTKIIMTFDF